MTRRDRLKGHRFEVAALSAEVRRSCRDELKILYCGPCFDRETWTQLATLGKAEVFEASRINASMKDLFRVRITGALLEGAVGGETVVAIFRGKGRLGARHAVEKVLRALFPPA